MSSSEIREIKERIGIVDVARSLSLTIKKSGSFYIADQCPHGHGSSSNTCFHILPDVQGYKCWNCGDSGDIFNLVGIARFGNKRAYKESIEYICSEFGINNPHMKMSPEAKKEYKKKRAEQETVRAVLKEACSFFHAATPDSIFDVLQQNYGIIRTTADNLLIGYTKGEGLFKHLRKSFSLDDIRKTGLLVKGEKFEFFKRRIIFPYWQFGEVVYLIARKVDGSIGAPEDLYTETGDEKQDKYEVAKYKKLRVYEDDNASREFISKTIRNDYLYSGSVFTDGDILITEGVTDCITANQAGIPCVSPVTTQFKDSDLTPVLGKLKKCKRVYICNDNEKSKAGDKGAIKTARYLATNGVNVSVVSLPLPEGKDKIDLCEYLRDNGGDEFRRMMKISPHIIEALVARIDTDLPVLEKLRELQDRSVFEWMVNMGEVDKEFHLGAIKATIGCNKSLVTAAMKGAEKKIKKIEQSDLAEKFAADCKTYAYRPQFKIWMEYKGGMWRRIETEVLQSAVQTYIKGIIGSYTATILTGVMTLLKGLMGVENWDCKKNLIPLQNGALDIETKILHQHDPAHRFTWQLPYPYETGDEMPTAILAWMSEAMGGTEQNIKILLAYLAAVLRGRTDLQRFLECDGDPGAGKGTYLRLAEMMIGETNTFTTTLSDLEAKGNRFITSRIIGKRLVIISDAERFAGEATILKSLTGQDSLPFDIKGVQVWEGGFKPDAMVLVAANEAIQTSDYAGAVDRRRLTIRFNHPVKNELQRNLDVEFLPELPKLLNLVLAITDEEILQLIKKTDQLEGSAQVRMDVLMTTNHLGAWANACLVMDEDAVATVGHMRKMSSYDELIDTVNGKQWLYPNYRLFCEQHGFSARLAANTFSNNLRSLLCVQLGLPGIEYHPRATVGGKYKPACFSGISVRLQNDSELEEYPTESVGESPIEAYVRLSRKHTQKTKLLAKDEQESVLDKLYKLSPPTYKEKMQFENDTSKNTHIGSECKSGPSLSSTDSAKEKYASCVFEVCQDSEPSEFEYDEDL